MEYATDEQQLEAIRQWFKKHGRGLLTTLLFVVAIGLGVRYWFHHKEVQKVQASEHYLALMMNQSEQDTQSIRAKAKLLVDEYPNTPYASLAALSLTKLAVEEQDFDAALKQLNWVIDNSPSKAFSLVARVRAARILIETNKLDEALTVLDVDDTDGYTMVIKSLKGDIYLLKDKQDKAKEAYLQAMEAVKEPELEQPFLRLKLQELGVQSFDLERDAS